MLALIKVSLRLIIDKLSVLIRLLFSMFLSVVHILLEALVNLFVVRGYLEAFLNYLAFHIPQTPATAF